MGTGHWISPTVLDYSQGFAAAIRWQGPRWVSVISSGYDVPGLPHGPLPHQLGWGTVTRGSLRTPRPPGGSGWRSARACRTLGSGRTRTRGGAGSPTRQCQRLRQLPQFSGAWRVGPGRHRLAAARTVVGVSWFKGRGLAPIHTAYQAGWLDFMREPDAGPKAARLGNSTASHGNEGESSASHGGRYLPGNEG